MEKAICKKCKKYIKRLWVEYCVTGKTVTDPVTGKEKAVKKNPHTRNAAGNCKHYDPRG